MPRTSMPAAVAFAALDASEDLPPEEALELLLSSFVQFTFEMPQWAKLWLLEPNAGNDVAAALRPDLEPTAARELVHVVRSIMSGTVYFASPLPTEERSALLTDAARTVLLSTRSDVDSPPRPAG